MKFSELELDSKLVQNLDENNFIECTEVQNRAIPKILQNKNLMVQAQTGTGKTASFLIPLIQRIISQKDWLNESHSQEQKILGMIVVPTRELAAQIFEDAEILGCEYFGIKGVVFSGGLSLDNQRKKIKNASFIVATPGRLLDFCSRDSKLLRDIEYFVLDECDRMFDMGFYPDLKKIISYLPPPEKRTSLLFSATIIQKVRNLARQSFYQTEEIDVSTSDLAVDKIKQEKVMVLHHEKFQFLLGLVSQMEESASVLVFTNTKHNAELVALKLLYNGINADFINGDLSQNRRQKVIQKFKQRTLTVLIATDVAARGIHVHNLDLVINFDIPDDPQSYIHRIGRTGRAGLDGEALSFVCEKFAYNLEAIESLLGHKIPVYDKDYHHILKEDISKNLKTGEIKKQLGRKQDTSSNKNTKSHSKIERKKTYSRDNSQNNFDASQKSKKKSFQYSDSHTRIKPKTSQKERTELNTYSNTDKKIPTQNKNKSQDKNLESITHNAIAKVSTDLKLERIQKKKKGVLSVLKGMFSKKQTSSKNTTKPKSQYKDTARVRSDADYTDTSNTNSPSDTRTSKRDKNYRSNRNRNPQNKDFKNYKTEHRRNHPKQNNDEDSDSLNKSESKNKKRHHTNYRQGNNTHTNYKTAGTQSKSKNRYKKNNSNPSSNNRKLQHTQNSRRQPHSS